MASSFIISSRGWLTCSLILLGATSAMAQSRGAVGPPVEYTVRDAARPASSASLPALPSLEPPRHAMLPANLHALGHLHEVVERMWQRSPTFRRQCARLARASLQVRLRMDMSGNGAGVRAHSRLTRDAGRLADADVAIGFGHVGQTVELIAHELEHVIEQLDGVDLASHVERGAARRLRGGQYETARAVEVGRRVAEEVGRYQEPPREAREARVR